MKKFIFFLLLVVCVALAYYNRGAIKEWWFGKERTINITEVTFLLKDDIRFDSLALFLLERGVLADTIVFLREVNHQFLTDMWVDAGKYSILSSTRIDRLVGGFKRAENGHGLMEKKVNVVFNHCQTLDDMAKNIAQCIHADSASISEHIHDPNTLKKYKFTLQQMPALFIPSTYELYYDTSAEEFVEFMAEQFRAYWNPVRWEQMHAIGLSAPSQVATLGSIVYSEQAKVAEEWSIIARLYLNRLEKGIKLQSDPTFKFCWGETLKKTKRLMARHRDIDCEYNTYKIYGLPPGPICLVPKKVLDAILNPDTNNFLFMCAKPDYSGTHNFTHSGVEHLKNAKKYQQWLTQQAIK